MYAIVVTGFCTGIAAFDLKTYRIPDSLLALFVPVMLIPEKGRTDIPISGRLAASLAVLIIFGAVWYFSKGIGMGDVKYAAVLGFILSPDRLIPALLFTGIICIIVYSIGLFFCNWSKEARLPFAPFLSAGVIMSLWGML
jgi:prepilin signal peptidase PulO-like enzyme (type II secretory pathway)